MKIAVIGLGHFGFHLCNNLVEVGTEVLAIDKDEQAVEKLRDQVNHSMILDTTDFNALNSIGINDYDHVVVSIGEDIEASLLTIANLQKIKVKNLIGRACSEAQEVILKQMKVEEIFLPEGDAAKQMARKLYLKGAQESINISKEYIIIEAQPPTWCIGKKVSDLHLVRDYEIGIVTIIQKANDDELLSIGKLKKIEVLGAVSSDTRIEKNHYLLLFGKEKCIHRFLNENS